ncbi:hypothetical protein GOV07_01010 [Candidatus Woesearchaeota archaeon]|nr:hypothetical protein [Candidatus Woesearchaeota archaeon]
MKAAKIVKELKRLKLDAWSVLFQEQEKSTLHLTKGEAIETSMDTKRVQAEITVYKRSGTFLGDSKFILFTDDTATIKAEVKDALIIANESTKPGWPLPKKQRYGKVVTFDAKIVKAFEKGDTEKLNLKLWKAMRAATKKEKGIKLNHAELHLTRTQNTIVNSEGLKGKNEATILFVEAIMTIKKQEFHNALTVGTLKDFSPKLFIKETADSARDVLAARKWKRVHEKGILLSGIALRDFWAPDLTMTPVVAHANAQAKHRHLSRFDRGQRVTKNKGFTLMSDPFISHNPASGKFDVEGTASKKLSLVEKGVCKEFVANQRYAHYLGVPPTGALGVISLSKGKEKVKDLREQGVVEIVSFSSFVPNSLSGDFSAEIRLGYLYEKGKKIPIRGAMFTGNVFTMLDAMRLSKEGMEMERYKGPAVVRFDEGCHLAGF